MGRRSAILAIAGALLSGAAMADGSAAQSGWTAEIVDAGNPVGALRQAGNEAFVYADRWFEATACATGVCLSPGRPPSIDAARDGIPGGMIARETGAGIVAAWYSDPTGRYDHGILGDAIEGGTLSVVDGSGNRYSVTLGPDLVFEDLVPRIADINGDGRNDVVTIRSGLTTGAAIAVYSLGDRELIELASIPPIGRTHRWLNVSGISDFNGDGRLDIAIVKTPHIGGRLEFWTFRNGGLARIAAAEGFSNHAIGSTELGMSAVFDIDGDGDAELAVPSADRGSLRIVGLAGGQIVQYASVALGGAAITAVVALGSAEPMFLVGRADGALILIRQAP